MEYIFKQIQKVNDLQLETLLPWSDSIPEKYKINKSIPHPESLYWNVVFLIGVLQLTFTPFPFKDTIYLIIIIEEYSK